MINGGMWELSLYADKQMEGDASWRESEEGKFVLGIIEQENERLKKEIVCFTH